MINQIEIAAVVLPAVNTVPRDDPNEMNIVSLFYTADAHNASWLLVGNQTFRPTNIIRSFWGRFTLQPGSSSQAIRFVIGYGYE